MRLRKSFQAKREILAQTIDRYEAAGYAQNSTIPDEFIAATGYSRKYDLRVLRHPVVTTAAIKLPGAPRYVAAVQATLRVAWEAASGTCAKRLPGLWPFRAIGGLPRLRTDSSLAEFRGVCPWFPHKWPQIPP